MSNHLVRPFQAALPLLLLSTFGFRQASAQAYTHGFCMGVAGAPPGNYVTRAFVLSSTNADVTALFRNALGKEHEGNVRLDASGCRFFPTAAEATAALRQLWSQSRTMSFKLVSINWLPAGASALPAEVPDSGTGAKPASPSSSGPT